MNATNRARAYLAKLPPAIAGQAGHAATFAAACRLVEFGLAFDEALSLLADWNQHCQPPWTEDALRHKLNDAFKRAKPKSEFAARVVTPRSRDSISGVCGRVTVPGPVPVAPADLPRSAQIELSKLTLTVGTAEQHGKLAQLRGLSVQAVALANERGLLRFAKYHRQESWFVLDASQRNALARRLDGQTWATRHGPAKAVMLKGSEGAWPIGILESAAFPCVAFVEGGPDFLAAFHFIVKERREQDCAPVAMAIGSPPIHASALPHFAGKRVRIYTHADAKGQGEQASARWFAQLESAGAIVDCFRFDGLRRFDGDAVKDLCDCARLHPDDARQHALEVLP